MSRVRADKLTDRAATGAPQLTYGVEVPVGYGITGAGGINVSGFATVGGVGEIAGSAVIGGITTISNTTESTSATTGALIISGGVGIAKSLNVTGNVTVGGTLTYEDVTNQDVIGLATFRSGVQFGAAGVGGTITAVGNAILSGITTIGTGLSFADNIEAKFGNSGDLRVYHDASNAYVAQSGVGDLLIQANTVHIRNAASTGTFFRGQTGAQTELYFNNSNKLETHNTGVKVTGIATISSDAFVGSVSYTHLTLPTKA